MGHFEVSGRVYGNRWKDVEIVTTGPGLASVEGFRPEAVRCRHLRIPDNQPMNGYGRRGFTLVELLVVLVLGTVLVLATFQTLALQILASTP